MTLLLLPPILFLAALGTPLLARVLRGFLAPVLALVPFGMFAWFLWQIPQVAAGNAPTAAIPWVPELGIAASARLDGLGLLFALLVTGIGGLILVYAGGYFSKNADLPRLLGFLLFFMGAMLGVVLADDLVFLFLYWELTSVSSFLLIGFKHGDPGSRRNALQALLVTGFGGLALLGGILLIGGAAGTYSAAELPEHSAAILGSPLFPLAFVLILLGAFTKSAQFPFHFWLPNAMAAPTPVSAYLHSATMVKAGVYLLARLNPALSDSPAWSITLFVFGAATMLCGGVLGLLQTDLKRILAYTTLAVLGMLTMLIGVGTELALQSAIFFLFGHALYKAALFLCAGNVDHACGTRDVTRLRGLRTLLPATAAAALLAALSKSGFPPFFGFLGKEYTYKAGAALEALSGPVLVVAFAVNCMLLALAFQAGVHPFAGKFSESRLDHAPHGLPLAMWVPPGLLALFGLVVGLFPEALAMPVVQSAVSAIEGQPVELKVALWHGWNLPVLLTALTFACGLGIYAVRGHFWKAAPKIRKEAPFTFDGLYDRLYNGLLDVAKWQTRVIQNGKLHRYLAVVVGVTLGLLAWKFTALAGIGLTVPEIPVSPLALTVMIAMACCAAVAITSSSRVAALANLGLTGYGIAFLFAHFGAPDLAITQVVVETLTVVFFMVALHHLPKIREPGTRRSRAADALLAGTAGAFVSLLALVSLHVDLAEPISSTLAAWSYPEAHGRNVVNVILVDFRALDTLGEILVLGIAAVGVVVLLSAARHVRARRGRGPEGGAG